MGVIIRRPYCTDSHADFFIRNLTVCKGDLVASSHGHLSQPVRIDTPAADAPMPITLSDAKAHLRLTSTTSSEETLITSWIKAAWRKVEADTGLILLTSEWRVYVHEYPWWGNALELPLWPIQSIDEFEYVDTNGDTQTVMTGSPAAVPYIVDYGSRPVIVQLDDEQTWPTDLRVTRPGTIEFTAGWTSPSLIPADLIEAMKLLIGEQDMQREHSIAGQGMTIVPVPLGYEQWVAPWVLPGV